MYNAQVRACVSKCRSNSWSMKISRRNSRESTLKTVLRNGLQKFHHFLQIWVRKIQSYVFIFLIKLFWTRDFLLDRYQFVIADKEKVLMPIRTRQLLILVLYTKSRPLRMSQAGVTEYRDLYKWTYGDQISGRAQRRWSVYRVMYWSRIQHLRHGNAYEFDACFIS